MDVGARNDVEMAEENRTEQNNIREKFQVANAACSNRPEDTQNH